MGLTSQEALVIELAGAQFAVIRYLRVAGNKFSDELRDKIVEHASGRPGPNVVTGEYVSSIEVDVQVDNNSLSVNAGSNAPQSMRLELGYTGTDANGRHYSQPPFPHFRPAFDEMIDRFEELTAGCGDLNIISGRQDD